MRILKVNRKHLCAWHVVVFQLLSCVQLFETPWTVGCQAPLSSTISQSLLRFMTIESVMLSNHLICCNPLLLLPSIFPSIRVFSKELALRIRWPKYWSFRFSISPFNEYSGLISFRMDWLDLLAVQGTLKSLLQHLNSKGSILECSAFFVVQLFRDFPGGSDGKASACNVGDLGSIPGSGRSSGKGNGYPLQYSCLENPMDGRAW